jgi:hypothetical protein
MAQEVSFKIKVDNQELDLAKLSVNEFNKVYSDTQQKLNSLPLGSAEWKTLNGELNTAQKAFEQTKDIATTSEDKFKSLKVQIRQTTVALQEAEEKGDMKTFNKLKNDLDDLNDKFELTQLKAMKFDDALATLPGVAGLVGQSLQGLDKGFKLLVANPIIATIGALVGLFMALKESLSRTEEGTQKLARIGEFLERVMNGLFAIIEPLANMLIDFVLGILESKNAMKVLGQVVGVTAGILAGAFNIIKTLTTFVVTNFINAFKTAAGVISGFGDILAGVFTFDFDRIKKGVSKVKDTVVVGFNNTVDNVKDTFKGLTQGTADAFTSAYDAAEKSFSEGFKRQTKRQKQLAKDAQDAADKIKKAKMDEINANEALEQSEDELAESRRIKDKNRLIELQNQEKFLKETYDREKQRIKDLLNVQGVTDAERKALMVEMNNLEAKYAQESQNLAKQITDTKKEQYQKDFQNYQDSINNLNRVREEAFTKEKNDLDLKYAKGEMSQLEYNLKVADLERQQSEQRLQNIQDDRDKSLAFQKSQFDAGIIQLEDYNTNVDNINREFDQKEFEGKTASNQAKVDQEKLLAQTLIDTKEYEQQAIIELEQMKVEALATLGGIISNLAGENKALAITGLLVEQAAAVADVLTRSARTKAELLARKAIYAAMIPNPVTAPIGIAGVSATSAGLVTNTIGTITALAGIGASIASGIAKITSANKSSGGGSSGGGGGENMGKNYERGGLIKGPRHAQGGVMIEAEGGEAVMNRGSVTMFAPLLSAMNQMGGGTSFNSNIMSRPDTPSLAEPAREQSPMVMKTYVVSNELTTEAEKQARLKDLSTL